MKKEKPIIILPIGSPSWLVKWVKNNYKHAKVVVNNYVEKWSNK